MVWDPHTPVRTHIRGHINGGKSNGGGGWGVFLGLLKMTFKAIKVPPKTPMGSSPKASKIPPEF